MRPAVCTRACALQQPGRSRQRADSWCTVSSLGLFPPSAKLPLSPGGSDGKESTCNAGDPGLIPGSGRSRERAMATHSSLLAWRIPPTEEPGWLQSMRLQRVGHD